MPSSRNPSTTVPFSDLIHPDELGATVAGPSTPRHNPAPTTLEKDLSCFELLNIFRSRTYISRAKLLEHVVLAQKDRSGQISWVDFDKPFHSHLVAAFFNCVGEKLSAASYTMLRRAMFVFILELLNGQAADTFFVLQSGKTKDNRAGQQKKRLSRKRSRAAKRERDRVHDKQVTRTSLGGPVDFPCTSCGRKFVSRKKFGRHTCATKAREEKKKAARQEKEVDKGTQNTSKPVERVVHTQPEKAAIAPSAPVVVAPPKAVVPKATVVIASPIVSSSSAPPLTHSLVPPAVTASLPEQEEASFSGLLKKRLETPTSVWMMIGFARLTEIARL